MILSAKQFTSYDACPRRYALEQSYEPRSITPIGLLYAGVEGGIVEPGGAIDAIRAVTTRKDVESGSLAAIAAVRHIGFMAEVVSLSLTRRFGRFRRVKPVDLDGHEWHSGLFESKQGLHRILLMSTLDDDALRGYAHAWATVGELAALRTDLSLTAVVVGSQRDGRRHSHWSKCYQHPIQKSALRFSRRKGGKGAGFTDGWREVWRERTELSAEVWVDKMEADEALEDLIRVHRVPFREGDTRIERAKADMFAILPQMASASVDDPMRRGSCDSVFGPCAFSPFCWASSPVEMQDLAHLYRAVSSVEHSEPQPA